jgi:hypothetical protein
MNVITYPALPNKLNYKIFPKQIESSVDCCVSEYPEPIAQSFLSQLFVSKTCLPIFGKSCSRFQELQSVWKRKSLYGRTFGYRENYLPD